MRQLLRRVLALALGSLLAASVLVAVTMDAPAFACSCARPSAKRWLGSAEVVFFGHKVDEIQYGGAPANPDSEVPGWADSYPGGYLTKFRVDRVFKGDVDEFQWVATTAGFAGGCGYQFDDESYVIAADRVVPDDLPASAWKRVHVGDVEAIGQSVETSLCGMMNEPSLGKVEKILGKGHEPR